MNLKHFCLLFIVLISLGNLYSQNSKQKLRIVNKRKHTLEIDTTIYLGDKTDIKASYKGGDSLLSKFFIDNFKWKANSNIQGTKVIPICFVVEKDGSRTYYPFIKDVNYIKEDSWLRDTALSIIKKMPPFEPATIKGKKVRSTNCIDVAICFNEEIFVQNRAQIPYEQGLHDGGYFNPCPVDTDEVFNFTDPMPEFPGGRDSMESFIKRNLIYPKEAKEAGVEGRVQVSFIVEKDGSLSMIKIAQIHLNKMQKGNSWGCDKEALRMVNSFPKFKTGTQNGKPVRVVMGTLIMFKINN